MKLLILAGLLTVFAATVSGPRPASQPIEKNIPADLMALISKGNAQACLTGCAIAHYPDPELDEAAFAKLLEEFSRQPMSPGSPALETLLFHGEKTAEQISARGTAPLDAARAAFLSRELSRTRARLSVRLIDEHGAVRLRMASVSVPLGEKQHLHPEHAVGIQPPEISGTIKRVGLHHLWARL